MRHTSSVVRLPFTVSSQKLLGQSLQRWYEAGCRVRRQEIVIFMIPRLKGYNFGVISVKLMFIFENLFFSGHGSEKHISNISI